MTDTRQALAALVAYVERNECRHEETHRGGAIWTICNDCGRKWADDRGGFVPYEQPKQIADAYAALDALSAQPVAGAVAQPSDELLRLRAEAEALRRDNATLLDACKDARAWMHCWASAERLLAVLDATIDATKGTT